MKVYLATSGEYSDYRVCHVFTRREDAENYPLGDDVEEYELQDGPVQVATWHSVYWYSRRPDDKGDSMRLPNPFESSSQRDFDGHLNHIEHSVTDNGTLVVSGWDLNGVRKVYSEQRAKILSGFSG